MTALAVPGLGTHARRLLAVIFLASVLIGLNSTMIGIALPRIVGDLDASAEQGTWMLLSFLLVHGSMLVLSGQLADSWSPGRVFRLGSAVFLVASVGLALAASAEFFIGLRALQGLGAAMLVSTSGAMVVRNFPPARVGAALGVYLAGFSVAQVAGPTVGGIITDLIGWRWMFAVTALLALAILVAGWRLVRDAVTRRSGRLIDPWGNLLILVGMGALLYAISSVQQGGWLQPIVLAGLAITAITVPVFVLVERRVPNPAIQVDLLTDRAFLLANTAGLLQIVPRVVPAVMLSLYYQGLKGAGPLEAALAVTPLAVGVTVGSLLGGRLESRWRTRDLAVATSIGTAIGLIVIIGAIAVGGPVLWVGVGLLVTGLAAGAFSTANTTMILSEVPRERSGSVNGVRTMFQSTGMAVGTALMLTIAVSGLSASQAQAFYAGESSAVSEQSAALLKQGYLSAFVVMLVLVLVALAIGIVLRRQHRARA